jgi:predicted nucleotidyltransferase
MDEITKQQIIECCQKYPEVDLFMLFGSRARGDNKAESDWDFGYVAKKNCDLIALYTELTLLLKTDNIDFVDLSKASGLLRYRVAQDGKPLYVRKAGEYEKFWLQAVHFWCDAGPIIRAEYEALLRRMA